MGACSAAASARTPHSSRSAWILWVHELDTINTFWVKEVGARDAIKASDGDTSQTLISSFEHVYAFDCK
jgi:hypothetical protein